MVQPQAAASTKVIRPGEGQKQKQKLHKNLHTSYLCMARALYFWTGDCQSSKQSLGFLHPLHPCLQESAPENISKSLCTLILWLLVWSVDGKKLTSVIQISTFDPFYSKAWPVPYIILRIIIIPRLWCDLLCLQNIVCISAAGGKGGATCSCLEITESDQLLVT